MKKFTKKQALKIVQSICQEQINDWGNELYKSFYPLHTDDVVGPLEVRRFHSFVVGKLEEQFGPCIDRRAFSDFTSMTNMIMLFTFYGLKIDVHTPDGITIKYDTIPDYELYYRYGIKKFDFVDDIDNYRKWKQSRQTV